MDRKWSSLNYDDDDDDDGTMPWIRIRIIRVFVWRCCIGAAATSHRTVRVLQRRMIFLSLKRETRPNFCGANCAWLAAI